MNSFTVTIQTENAAFDDGMASELARILRRIAAEVEHGQVSGIARDVNGNSVGDWGVA